MTLYRDQTTPELVETGLAWIVPVRHDHVRRLIFALCKRLEEEYGRAEALYQCHREFAETRPEVGKPHITRVKTAQSPASWDNVRMWKCTGPFGGSRYGINPRDAYINWKISLARRPERH